MQIDSKRYGELLGIYQPKVITTEADYERTLKVIQVLMAIENRSAEESEILSLMVLLVEYYERNHFSIPEAAPHEILQHLLESKGVRQESLVGQIGSRGVVSEIVNGKRSISKGQAKALASIFGVKPDLFI